MPPGIPNSDDGPSRSPSPSPQLNPVPALAQIDIPGPSKAIYQAVLQDASKLGAVWSECVAAFIAFEKAAGFQLQDNRLPASKNRPRQLGEWFKHGRKVSGNAWDSFCDEDPVTFGSAGGVGGLIFNRRTEVEMRLVNPRGMESISSGMLFVSLAAAGFSGACGAVVVEIKIDEGGSPATMTKWEDAAKDVIWVLGQLADGYDTGSEAKGAPQTKKRM